jgi:Transcriptional Coactivator p15 (PC4)
MSTRTKLTAPIEIAKFWRNRRGESIHIILKEFEGRVIADLRVYFTDRKGITQPSKKGLALQVRKLPELLKAIESATAKATALGLLDESAE